MIAFTGKDTSGSQFLIKFYLKEPYVIQSRINLHLVIVREFITCMVSKMVNTRYSLQSQNLITMEACSQLSTSRDNKLKNFILIL
jgi:hypothetical protein